MRARVCMVTITRKVQEVEQKVINMRLGRKLLYNLLTTSPRGRVGSGRELGGATRHLASWRASLAGRRRDEVKSTGGGISSRRYVHSSGPWPNTQPHVLNGEGGLHQLTTVHELKEWFEKRKKEIYGEDGNERYWI